MSKEVKRKKKEMGERRICLFPELYRSVVGTAQPSRCDGVVNDGAPRLICSSKKRFVKLNMTGGETVDPLKRCDVRPRDAIVPLLCQSSGQAEETTSIHAYIIDTHTSV